MEPNIITKHTRPRGHRHIARLAATAALAMMFSGVLANRHINSAHASEFEPIPDAKIEANCALKDMGVMVYMYNNGLGAADFDVETDIGGTKTGYQYQVLTTDSAHFVIPDDTVATISVSSNSGQTPFYIEQKLKVDCSPNPSGLVQLFCPEGPGQNSAYVHYQAINDSLVYDTQFQLDLPDGSYKMVDVDAKDHFYLDVNVAEGEHVVADLKWNDMVLGKVDTTVDCQDDPPPTTEPPTTAPPTTAPPTDPPTTTVVEIPPPTDPPTGGDLPETGSGGSGAMAAVAGLLALAGLGFVGIARRRPAKG